MNNAHTRLINRQPPRPYFFIKEYSNATLAKKHTRRGFTIFLANFTCSIKSQQYKTDSLSAFCSALKSPQ